MTLIRDMLAGRVAAAAASLAAAITLCIPAKAQGTGETFYSFLNIPTSVTAMGLGGVNISTLDDDINAADRNPGLLGPESDRQLGANYMHYIGDSNFGGVKYSQAAGDHGAWLASAQYMAYGSFKGYDANGVATGDFSPKDIILAGTYAHDITERWRGGATLRTVYSAYAGYTAVAVGTDLGINYYDPESDLSFSAVAANLGGQVKRFERRYDRLPLDLRLGLSKGLASVPVVLSVTAWNLTRWHLPYIDSGDGSQGSEPQLKDKFMSNLLRHLVFATDFAPAGNFHIGLGYNYKTRTDMSTYKRSLLSGFSACVGLGVKTFNVGAAIAQPHSGATVLMLNISTSFAAGSD